jgi:hypothetical protein
LFGTRKSRRVEIVIQGRYRDSRDAENEASESKAEIGSRSRDCLLRNRACGRMHD